MELINTNILQRKKYYLLINVLKSEKYQQKSNEGIFPKDQENIEIKNEIDETKRFERKVFGDKLFYEENKQVWF